MFPRIGTLQNWQGSHQNTKWQSRRDHKRSSELCGLVRYLGRYLGFQGKALLLLCQTTSWQAAIYGCTSDVHP